MAFYLRKHFGAGPFRLNLSKGGLGLSAGVTGARVGLSPRGAYVHGGRHGMYYRKYMGGIGRQGVQGREQSGDVQVFVDSGLTYKPADINPSVSPPLLSPMATLPVGMRLLGAACVAVFLLSFLEPFLLAPAMIMVVVALWLTSWYNRQSARARSLFHQIKENLREKDSVVRILQTLSDSSLHKRFRPWLDERVYLCFQEAYYEDPDYILPQEMEALEGMLHMDHGLMRRIKSHAFGDFLDSLMEDHIIDKDEEVLLLKLQEDLRIHDNDIAWEKHLLSQFARFRDAMKRPLAEVEVPVRLKDSETCFFSARGRLLREKVVRRYQRQGVRYKEVAYETDMEGLILLTSGRIMVVGGGSRSYPISRVLDLTLSLEDHCLLVVLDGRKAPLVLSMEEVSDFAGVLSQIVEAPKQ